VRPPAAVYTAFSSSRIYVIHLLSVTIFAARAVASGVDPEDGEGTPN